MDAPEFPDSYCAMLRAFFENEEEQHLAKAADMGRMMLHAGVPPEEIAEIHEAAIRRLADEFPDKTLLESVRRISAPLLEVLMSYGLAFREREDERMQAKKQVRELYRRLGATEESERQKIARELHDEFGQLLTALKMDVGWLAGELDLRDPVNKEQFSEKLAAMMLVLNRAVHSVRRVTTMLRPVILDTLGIIPALEWLASDFQERTGFSCDVSVCASFRDISVDAEFSTALFRITQEFLTNVVRHANASEVQITLSAKENRWVLDLTDNGIGIAPERIHSTDTLGLLGMKERAEMLGGALTIVGRAGEGTRATVFFPV